MPDPLFVLSMIAKEFHAHSQANDDVGPDPAGILFFKNIKSTNMTEDV